MLPQLLVQLLPGPVPATAIDVAATPDDCGGGGRSKEAMAANAITPLHPIFSMCESGSLFSRELSIIVYIYYYIPLVVWLSIINSICVILFTEWKKNQTVTLI